jgi:trimeric autotransporter adhesin
LLRNKERNNPYFSADHSMNMRYIILTFFAALLSITSFAAVGVAPISSDTSVCVKSTVPLSDTTTGGTWSSSNTGIATVDSALGIVTGVSAGTATISYTVGAFFATATVTVNPLPPVNSITGGTYCAGAATISLSPSTIGVTYQQHESGVAVYAPLAGTGGPLWTR